VAERSDFRPFLAANQHFRGVSGSNTGATGQNAAVRGQNTAASGLCTAVRELCTGAILVCTAVSRRRAVGSLACSVARLQCRGATQEDRSVRVGCMVGRFGCSSSGRESVSETTTSNCAGGQMRLEAVRAPQNAVGAGGNAPSAQIRLRHAAAETMGSTGNLPVPSGNLPLGKESVARTEMDVGSGSGARTDPSGW
jgi:hypothetical protein